MEERGFGIGRSLAYGALAGLLVVVAVGGYLWWRVVNEPRSAGSADVIVVLALPDEEGVVLPRVIERVRDGSAESVDPLTTATVPGTSYNQLRETYPFSGAQGLAQALAQDGQPRPSYVLFDQDAWEELAGSEPLTLEIPEQMDVFDGEQMFTFREGEREVDPQEIAPMLNGADYLGADARERLRDELGAQLLGMISQDGIGSAETDLSAEELTAWLSALGE